MSSPLLSAVQGGHIHCVIALAGAGADVEAQDMLGSNCLEIAIGMARLDLVKCLLGMGAPFQPQREATSRSIANAVSKNSEDLLNHLLKIGLDPRAGRGGPHDMAESARRHGHIQLASRLDAMAERWELENSSRRACHADKSGSVRL